MRHPLTLLAALALVLAHPVSAQEKPPGNDLEQSSIKLAAVPTPVPEAQSAVVLAIDPFTLPRDRIVPGTTFLLEIVQDGAIAVGDPAKTLFDPAKEKVILDLEYETGRKTGQPVIRSARVQVESIKVVDGRHYLEARMPSMGALKEIATQSHRGGFLCPYRATLVATISSGDANRHRLEYPVFLPSVGWAYFWGVLIVIAIGFTVGFLRNGFGRPGVRWDPLGATITPAGGYSLSLVQSLIWTYVTVFGLVYVYRLTANFLDISTQMLVLLGVGGSTALAKRIAAGEGIPSQYLGLLPPRTPKLRDLVWRGGDQGGLDLFKIQMLVFTLLIAYIVLWEIARRYAFPNIPDNLVALMGVSSALYVGNSAAQKGELVKRWQAIEPQAKDLAERIGKAQDPEKAALQEQLRGLLDELY